MSKYDAPGVIILGTDTEVGKTYQACRLAAHLSNRLRVGVYKPVASGNSNDVDSDRHRLAAAAGCMSQLDRVCPQMFSAPVAPPVAARLEGRTVNHELLITGAHWWRERCEFLIVEGAGGVLSPISDTWTCLDLAQALKLPILLVALNRLGVVNLTLLCVESISRRKLRLLSVVLNSLPTDRDQSSELVDQSLGTNRSLLEQFCDRHIIETAEQWEPMESKTP